MDDVTIARMRARATQCRVLAHNIADKRTEKILRDMACEIEADIRRLEAQRAAGPTTE